MNGRAALASLVVAGCLVAAAPASARVQRIQRGPDRVVNYCNQQQFGAKCAPIASGDLNGDGKTDAVFLRLSSPNQRSVNGDFGRSLDILFGPFSALGSSGARADVVVTISAGNTVPSVGVADYDGDGRQDLIYAEALRSLNLVPAELQRVAVLKGEAVWQPSYTMGPAYQGSYVIERRVPLSAEQLQATARNTRLASRLTPQVADVDGDGKGDLLLAVDPPVQEAAAAIGSLAPAQPLRGEADSHLLVFLDAPAMAERSTMLDLAPGQESSRIEGLGACSAASLLGAGDLNLDGLTDIVTRRCPGRSVPDMLGLVPGRSDWPAQLRIDGAVVAAAPEILPPGPEPTAAPVDPELPRGYVAFTPAPKSLFDRPAAFFIQDVDQDGALDVGFGFSDKTHVWLGGRDIAARLRRNQSDRIYLQAGFGGTSLSGSWRVSDLTGDGKADLLLTQRTGPHQEALAERPVPAPIVLGAAVGDVNRPAASLGGGGADILTEPLKIYAGARPGQRVLDLAADTPDAILHDPAMDLWLIGDFNGDGRDDLMLGSPGQSSTSSYAVLFGPIGG